jgi:hypothetical protein
MASKRQAGYVVSRLSLSATAQVYDQRVIDVSGGDALRLHVPSPPTRSCDTAVRAAHSCEATGSAHFRS